MGKTVLDWAWGLRRVSLISF